MAASRKLQTEIQQVLKKVEEGVQLFDEIWEKVYAASGQNLKEKYEGDLKKEIKKLQRLRDQIKTWISSADVKDKSQLTDARKTIETKMEQFKICEKDTKTKAYSKEGLARGDRLDPRQAEKDERRVWINEALEYLGDLINGLEADIEKLGGGKNSKKLKTEIQCAENRINKNQWHVNKLELILRKMDMDEIEPSLVDKVRDDLEYYVESAADDDGAIGVLDEFDIYEDLELGDDGGEGGADGSESKEKAPGGALSSKADDDERPATKAAPAPSNPSGGIVGLGGIGTIGKATNANKLGVVSPVKGKQPLSGTAGIGKAATVASPAPTAKDTVKANAPTAAATLGGSTPTGTTWASAAQQKAPVGTVPSQPPQAPTPAEEAEHDTSTPSQSWQQQPQQQGQGQSGGINLNGPAAGLGGAAIGKNIVGGAQGGGLFPSGAQGPGAAGAPFLDLPASQTAIPSGGNAPGTVAGGAPTSVLPSVRPQVHPDHLLAAHLLSQSMVHSPEGVDSDGQTYTPRNAYATHPAFPTQPLTNAECAPLFERLPADTVFFAFYHQQDSYQQYLAARQLKKQNWRFHKKYMTWFQRHKEPKVKTDDYEEGTYAYFDYEVHSTRFKSDFKFEFQYLEDELPAAP